jgi:hypothetical protein
MGCTDRIRVLACLWRISNYHLKTTTWTVLYQKPSFPTLPCHERPVGVTCPSLTTLAKLSGPRGAKAIVADNLLMKQQLTLAGYRQRMHPINHFPPLGP